MIRVLDVLTGWFKLWNNPIPFPGHFCLGVMGMPLTELCEFLANYPNW
jgi:hypothetical protein